MAADQKKFHGTFAEILKQVRAEKGLSQSELARKIWGTVQDARGYEVAKNRDRISAYEGGRAKPTDANLRAIAEVLGMDVEELAPDLTSDTVFADPTPSVELRVAEGGTFLRVNAKVPADVALEVVNILQKAGVR